MSPQAQSIVALAIVAVAAAWLVVRARRRRGGCGGGCACPSTQARESLLRGRRG